MNEVTVVREGWLHKRGKGAPCVCCQSSEFTLKSYSMSKSLSWVLNTPPSGLLGVIPHWWQSLTADFLCNRKSSPVCFFRWIHQNMAAPLLHLKERWLLHWLQREAWGVQWPQPPTAQQLLCRRSIFPPGQQISIRVCYVLEKCVYVLLADVSVLCRMPADEDRAPEAQHICHSLPAMDLCDWAYLPRRQQWGEVKDCHSKGFIFNYIFSLFC